MIVWLLIYFQPFAFSLSENDRSLFIQQMLHFVYILAPIDVREIKNARLLFEETLNSIYSWIVSMILLVFLRLAKIYFTRSSKTPREIFQDLTQRAFLQQTPMRNESERSRSPVRPATVQYDTCCQGRATAIYIDKVSRFFFPFSFLILNVVYWSTFL